MVVPASAVLDTSCQVSARQGRDIEWILADLDDSLHSNCYFRYAIRAYASVQAFQPERGDRGVAYESWLLTGRTEWEQH